MTYVGIGLILLAAYLILRGLIRIVVGVMALRRVRSSFREFDSRREAIRRGRRL